MYVQRLSRSEYDLQQQKNSSDDRRDGVYSCAKVSVCVWNKNYGIKWYSGIGKKILRN